MNKIKVMIVYNHLFYGGTEEYIKQLIEVLDKNKFEISICCLIEKGLNTDWFEKNGIRIFTLNARNKFILLNSIRNLIQIIRLVKLFKKERIQIVHTHDFFPAFITRIACLFTRVPVVFLTLHNLFEWLNSFHHLVNRLLAKKTTKIISVSKSVMERSIKFDKIPEPKYIVIYNSINTIKFSADKLSKSKYRNEFNISENTFVVGCVGSFSKRKGQKYLLNAFFSFQKVIGNSKLIFVGGGDNNEPQIKNELLDIIRRNNVQDKVIFTGPRNDVNKLNNVFDLFVLPSVVEGFGYAVVEALSLELPILVSDISTFKEITKNGEYGELFKTNDEDDLFNKMIYCFNNIEYLKQKTRIGRIHVLKNFSLDAFSNSYNRLYNSFYNHLSNY